MLFFLILLAALAYLWIKCPWLPRVLGYPINRMLAKIWTPDKSRMNKEVLERIKELYVDYDVPEETAILIASKEHMLSEDEILGSLNAIDAKDFMDILLGNKRKKMNTLLRIFIGKRNK